MTKQFTSILKTYLLALLLLPQLLFAREWVGLNASAPASSRIQLVSSDVKNSVLSFSLSGFFKNEVITNRGNAFTITTIDATQLLESGAPDLPKFTASVIIPDKEAMKVEITASTYKDIPNIEIAPSKGNLLRTVNPDEVGFNYGAVYLKNNFFPSQIATMRKPYILRDFRGQTVVVSPFQYNPVTKVLRVFTSLTMAVSVDKPMGENVLDRTALPERIDNEFASIYQHQFRNYGSVQYIPTEENGSLLVICPTQWTSILQPLIDWKIQRGIPVEVVDPITAGTSAINIKDYIAVYYNTHNLTHVLLIGDDAQIPSLIAGGGASDPGFGYVLGNDSYSEVFVGRFAGVSNADIQTQVDRVLNYEKYPDANGSWYHRGIAVASNQGPGDDNEMDWEHEVNIRSDYLGFTYTDVAEIYDGTHTTTTDAAGDPTNIDLMIALQNGASVVSYTGHGSVTSFGTTGFSNNDVQLMTNVNQLPFIWSVGCVNGDFLQTLTPCFGEAFLNAQYNGQPVGAIATMMSSINQSWNPPMDGQDEMVDLLAELYPTNIKRTFGGISFNGCMHMNDVYGQSGADMTDTWICFGDPTLNVRTATPQQVTITHDTIVPVGITTLLINCNHDSAFVVLTMNGAIISTGIVSGGMVQLNFPALSVIDTLILTVTGFNLMPYWAKVQVIPANGPFVYCESNVSTDSASNNNGVIECNETINVDLTLHNAGLVDATGLNIVVSTNDPYINIISANATLSTVVSNTSATVLNAISYLISDHIPDQHIVQFLVTISDNAGNTWTSAFTQLINAPKLFIGSVIINDSFGGNGNGVLEAGETADLIIDLFNNGHSPSEVGYASLNSTTSFFSINTAVSNVSVLLPQAQTTATFNVTLLGNLMPGSPYDFTCQFDAGAYIENKLFNKTAGENLEDFETANFNKYEWLMQGSASWFTTNSQPFQGSYCAQSGLITDNQFSDLLLLVNVLADDSVSFWYKVSSEQDYDFLNYKIDNVTLTGWSGTIPWTYANFPITIGTHLIEFSYEKDAIVSSGSDCAWLDNIRLPYGALVTAISGIDAVRDGISCYPNPTSSIINVVFGDDKSTVEQMQLLDVNGKILKTQLLNQGTNSGGVNTANRLVQFSTDGISTGMYLLKIETNNKIFYKKIVVE